MRVAVVIPAFNAKTTLDRCLDACLRQTRPADEIVVVDDGSTDETPRIAEAHGVHCIVQQRQGPAAARNAGTRAARADIVVFTDSDCVPEPEWLERLLDGFAPGVAGVGGGYGIENSGSWLARAVHEEIRTRHAALGLEVDYLGSFNVAYRKEVFEAAGGFDETFTAASGEDNDLAYRIQDAGGTLRYVRNARVGHFHPERLWPYLRTQQRHGYWRMKLYRKHPGRAARGDKYAGAVDLICPPLSLALVAGIGVTIALCALGHALPAANLILSIIVIGYGAIHAVRAWWMARQAADLSLLGFAGVAVLRDVARAVGMVRGIWRFHVAGLES
ncbi:MAG: glycosyltransferase [Candidatus Hydrogenedentes bacterium]|nr:glycosyltransferase [Candidatus Hydrogenedentota bacterium]